jgi:hypothetical protein
MVQLRSIATDVRSSADHETASINTTKKYIYIFFWFLSIQKHETNKIIAEIK